MLERHGQPVGRRSSKMGGGDELRERGRACLEGAENGRGLVQHADSARVVHRSILASRRLRCKYDGRRAGKTTLPADRSNERTDREDGRHVGGEGLGRARRATGHRRGARPPLHRPPPRARGDEPAGVRGPAARGSPGAPPGPHPGDRGPQHPHARHRPADRRRDEPHADPDAAQQRRRVRRAHPLARRRGPGHRPPGRPAARAHAAGPDGGLRRLAHVDARRVRRARVRHRHQRGRARARHADAAAGAVQDDGDHGRRRAARRAPRARTSSWRSSPRSAPAAVRATCSSTAARPSARCRWKPA